MGTRSRAKCPFCWKQCKWSVLSASWQLRFAGSIEAEQVQISFCIEGFVVPFIAASTDDILAPELLHLTSTSSETNEDEEIREEEEADDREDEDGEEETA